MISPSIQGVVPSLNLFNVPETLNVCSPEVSVSPFLTSLVFVNPFPKSTLFPSRL